MNRPPHDRQHAVERDVLDVGLVELREDGRLEDKFVDRAVSRWKGPPRGDHGRDRDVVAKARGRELARVASRGGVDRDVGQHPGGVEKWRRPILVNVLPAA